MKIEEMKSQSFKKYTLSDWESKVEKTLKGKTSADLQTTTYENIKLKPLYTNADSSSLQKYSAKKQENNWFIAQEKTGESTKAIAEKLENAIANGENCLSFSIKNQSLSKEIEDLFQKLISFPQPLFIVEKNTAEMLTSYLISNSINSITEQGINGVISYDIISSTLNSGHLITTNSNDFTHWVRDITKMKEICPEIKTILINTSPYHNAGSNSVQELAYALLEGVQYIEWLTNSNWSVDEVAERMVFHFSISSQFFTEIAKLRAFKQLWVTVLNAYGVSNPESKIKVSAETSSFTKSNLDSYVNMLRSGGEAFSAVLGGVDYLKVGPFNEASGETNPFSERIARNTQHILKEESHLNKVVDPGAGSYFIESLTEQLGKMTWEIFVQRDESGGILDHLENGSIQEEINEVLEKRTKDLAVRKNLMIGTNIFANLEETLSIQNAEEIQSIPSPSYKKITPLPPHRLSEPFENLRTKALELKNKQYSVTAGLICLGSLKDHKPRADYVSGVLASGGIDVVKSTECRSKEELANFIKNNTFEYYVICGKDNDYHTYVNDVLKVVGELAPKSIVDIAGKPDEKNYLDWKKEGLKGCVYSGQDILTKLMEILNIWEGDNCDE